MVHNFNPSTPGDRQEDLCKFKASLIYIVSSGPAKAT